MSRLRETAMRRNNHLLLAAVSAVLAVQAVPEGDPVSGQSSGYGIPPPHLYDAPRYEPAPGQHYGPPQHYGPQPSHGYGRPPTPAPQYQPFDRTHDSPQHQYKPIKAPCCTANFKKKQVGGYTPTFSYVPVLNSLLFPPDTCPHKTDNAICQIAGELYAKPGTTYGVKIDYYPRKQTGYKPRYHHDHGYSLHIEGEDESISRVDPHIDHGVWWSDTHADLVVVNNGCCFNLFPAVSPGDKILTECNNGVVGDVNELYRNFQYSILTPGDTNLPCDTVRRRLDAMTKGGAHQHRRRLQAASPCVLQHTAIMNNWLATDNYSVAATSQTAATSLLGHPSPLVVIDQVAENAIPPNIISVNAPGTNDEAIIRPGGDPSSRINPAAITEDVDDLEDLRTRVAAQNCALSNHLGYLEENGEATLSGSTLTLDCTSVAYDLCVIDVDAADINNASALQINYGTVDQLLINVNTDGILNMNFETTTFSPADNDLPIVWNVKGACAIRINTDTTAGGFFYGHLLAPVASAVNIGETNFIGNVLLGNPSSVLSTVDGTEWGEDVPLVRPFPHAEPRITLCTCLCPEGDYCPQDPGFGYHR